MLDLTKVPLFAEFSEDGHRLLGASVGRLEVRTGCLVMRRGARCRELFVIAAGRLSVRMIGGSRRSLGPGEILGEMSVISDAAISATVIADQDSVLWTLPRDVFLDLVDREPSLSRKLLRLLSQRLRTREAARVRPTTPQVVVIVDPGDARVADQFPGALRAVVSRHLPQVRSARHRTANSAVRELEAWRDLPGADALLIGLPGTELSDLAAHLEPQDAVLAPTTSSGTTHDVPHGLADLARLRFVCDGDSGSTMAWSFPVVTAELERVMGGIAPSRGTTPMLDRLARWVARKEIGIALGSGAARGFAHLGVLAELESLGLPVDRIVGTSMGGIAGLLYGLGGDGTQGLELARRTLGRRGTVRLRWIPRSSVFSDRELRRRARAVAGNRTFADLHLPVAVVATDLVRGQRVVIDRGRVADGFFATSAVPGVLPPVIEDDAVLVDGALVARIPLDLLPPSRCGLRVAVNVIPSLSGSGGLLGETAALRKRISKLLGFREVLGRSWNHAGWFHAARDAADADVLLEPSTRELSGVDFATAWEPMAEAGRLAVREHADELRAAAAELLAPDLVMTPDGFPMTPDSFPMTPDREIPSSDSPSPS